jgi:protein ImuB
MMKRIVSVWLPDWPITVWLRPERFTAKGGPQRPPEDAPFALVERGPHGLVLSALNAAARQAGLRRGQAHADARAMLPTLLSAPAEPERDLAALRRLALWAERFSPCVAVDAAMPGLEGLLLDMTGGAHLFGGEAALLADLDARLTQAGIAARAAIADTPAAAWALARFAAEGESRIAPAGGAREALAGLPLEALRLEAPALALLRKFGLRLIGDLYGLPRAGLARRFRGPEGLRAVERLDQALGAAAEPLVPERRPPDYRAWMAFAEPVTHVEGVAARLPDLARALCGQLARDGRGARRLALVGFRVDGRATMLEAGLSAPAAEPAHLLRLLKEKGLEHLDLGFGLDGLMLCAVRAETMTVRQGDMDETIGGAGAAPATALAPLIDRLQARLGEGAVRRPVLRESWVPEASEAWVRAGPGAPPAPERTPERLRPILLLDPPEAVEAPLAEIPEGAPVRFVWRRATHRVVKAEGPERLGAEWWRQAGARTRDYYRVEDEQGRRYWLFREGLHGREDAERAPSWWLHGVFA